MSSKIINDIVQEPSLGIMAKSSAVMMQRTKQFGSRA